MRTASLAVALTLLVAAANAAPRPSTAIVPVAGSVTGANGEKFRTALRVRGNGPGRIYFRGSSHFGDERDPFVAYYMPVIVEGGAATVYFDDIMGAIGATGLGSLDVIPDRPEYTAGAEAYVYHLTPGGRFGGDVPSLRFDQLRDSFEEWLDAETLETSRINIGIRTFDQPVEAIILAGADISHELNRVEVPANSFRQYPLAQLIEGSYLCPTLNDCVWTHGNPLTIHATNEAPLLVYLTITDNGSGDPRVYLSRDPE
jgi:hypothetical protein